GATLLGRKRTPELHTPARQHAMGASSSRARAPQVRGTLLSRESARCAVWRILAAQRCLYSGARRTTSETKTVEPAAGPGHVGVPEHDLAVARVGGEQAERAPRICIVRSGIFEIGFDRFDLKPVARV